MILSCKDVISLNISVARGDHQCLICTEDRPVCSDGAQREGKTERY